MSKQVAETEIVLELAEEFVERFRQGQRPSIREYAERYPHLAGEIRDVFPAMAMMEHIAPDEESLAASQDAAAAQGLPAGLEQLGDFRILREVGHGGMGIVYEAEQVSLGRHVALKVLPHSSRLSPRHRHRFEREARAAAKLHHTNIVPVFGIGEHAGLCYYVMQFIQGLGLDTVLNELRRLRAGGGMSATATLSEAPNPPGREGCAAEIARSLMTGAFDDGRQAVGCEEGSWRIEDSDEDGDRRSSTTRGASVPQLAPSPTSPTLPTPPDARGPRRTGQRHPPRRRPPLIFPIRIGFPAR